MLERSSFSAVPLPYRTRALSNEPGFAPGTPARRAGGSRPVTVCPARPIPSEVHLRARLASPALLVLLSACSPHAFPAVGVGAAPGGEATREIRVCVVEGMVLRQVAARVDPATGDTTVRGVPFAEAHPATAPTYAASATWFINDEPIEIAGRRYVKYGLPRNEGIIFGLQGDVEGVPTRHRGEFQGTPLFIEPGADWPARTIYVPVRPGCSFQAYGLQSSAGG
jgi:hypothetical protein